MTYIDAYVLPVPKNRVDEYKQIVSETAPFWREYGATAYMEAMADDAPYGNRTSFPRSVEATDDETVFVSWLIYPDKATRDAANQKMMSDPRMKDYMDKMPTDGDRMIFGGFEVFHEQ
jgi:uncharacterized protein YbaA (DUF1428 family)